MIKEQRGISETMSFTLKKQKKGTSNHHHSQDEYTHKKKSWEKKNIKIRVGSDNFEEDLKVDS